MDFVAFKEKAMALLEKYKYACIILLIGIGLMVIPVEFSPEAQVPMEKTETVSEKNFPDELARILSQIQGAGKVQVMLTEVSGESVVYQTNTDTQSGANGSIRVETVIISCSDREEQALVTRVDAPVYRGAIIVCQGADSAVVRLAIVEAVSRATGLGADKISVLKMK